MTHDDHEKIAASVIAALDVDKIGNRARSVREIGAVVAAGVGFVATVTIGLVELQAKPSTPQVETMIEAHTAPVVERVIKTEAAAEDLAEVRRDVERIEDVQGYLIEQSSWQGDILEHIAGGNRGRAPTKPESLKAKERELLRR